MQNLAVYMILVTAFLQALPENSYRKYVRFFCGLLLTVLLAQPVLDLMGEAGQVTELYRTAEPLRQAQRDTGGLYGVLRQGGKGRKAIGFFGKVIQLAGELPHKPHGIVVAHLNIAAAGGGRQKGNIS